MKSARTDVALGALVSTALHAAALAAAGSYVLLHGSPAEPETRAPLEVVLIDRQAFESELDSDRLFLPADPVRVPKVHRALESPEWPVLRVAATPPAAHVARVRVMGSVLPARGPSSRPQVDHPRQMPLMERSEEPRTPAEPARATPPATATPTGPVSIDATSSLVLSRPELRYPPRALRRGIEGVTRVGVQVGLDGLVTRVWVMESSGNRSLDRAAVGYLEGFAFDPSAVAVIGRGRSFVKRVRFTIE